MAPDSEDVQQQPGLVPDAPVQEPGEPAHAPLRTSENPPWSGWDVLLIAFVALFSILLFTFGAMGIASRLPVFRGVPIQDLARDPRLLLPVQMTAYAVVMAFMVLLVRVMYKRQFWRSVKWNWPQFNQGCSYLLGGIGLALFVQLSSAFLPIPKSMPIESMFKTPLGAYLMGAFGISVAPLMEELFFRGFLYPALARRIRLWPGIVVTSLAFAALHASQLGHAWAPMLLLFVVGLTLTVTRARTGSVATGFLMHVGYNLTLFVLLWQFSDHFRHMDKGM